MDYKEYLHRRLDRRLEKLTKFAEELHSHIDRGKIQGEEERAWIESNISGEGLDIACGSFPIEGAEGIDGDRKVGSDWVRYGDQLFGFPAESKDFVSCNYFDCFPNPLKVLGEWWRVLKPGGLLILICPDAEKHPHPLGPLSNGSKAACFTSLTLQFYVRRMGFSVSECFTVNGNIRLKGTR